jgi:hypothetical protein
VGDARALKLAEAMAKADAPAGEGIYAKCPSIYTSKAELALACIYANPKSYGLRADLGTTSEVETWEPSRSAVGPNV